MARKKSSEDPILQDADQVIAMVKGGASRRTIGDWLLRLWRMGYDYALEEIKNPEPEEKSASIQ